MPSTGMGLAATPFKCIPRRFFLTLSLVATAAQLVLSEILNTDGHVQMMCIK